MSVMVPEEIVVGSTTYSHTAHDGHDLYVVKGTASLGAPNSDTAATSWRYGISKKHAGTNVYFSNLATGESVWVLPDIHPGKLNGEEEAVMVVRGAVPRASHNSTVAATRTQEVVRDEKTSTGSSIVAKKHQQGVVNDTHTAANIVQPRTSTTLRQEIEERIQKNMREKLLHSATINPTTRDHSSVVVVEATRAQKVDEGIAVPTSNNRSATTEGKNNASGAAEEVQKPQSALDRFAAWRTKRSQGAVNETSAPPQQKQQPLCNVPPTVQTAMEKLLVSNNIGATMDQPDDFVGQGASLQQAIIAEKVQQMIDADEMLTKEREHVLQSERLVLQRAQCCSQERCRIEEELLRIVRHRRDMEKRRDEIAALELQVREGRHSQLVESNKREVSQCASQGIGMYNASVSELNQKVEIHQRRDVTLVEAVSKSLLNEIDSLQQPNPAVVGDNSDGKGRPTTGGQTVIISSESQEEKARWDTYYYSKYDTKDDRTTTSLHINNNTNPKRPPSDITTTSLHINNNNTNPQHPPSETINYSSAFQYVGNIKDIHQRKLKHGAGRYLYDAAGKSYHQGSWAEDLKEGHGVMSVPHALYDGHWGGGKMNGRAILQTPKLKGLLHFKDSVPHGVAKIETVHGETFSGKFSGGGGLGSVGHLALTSKDEVEWTWKNNHQQRGTGNVKATLNPSAASRVGSISSPSPPITTYVGEVRNFSPHGHGILNSSNGAKYTGSFDDGTISGRGTYYFPTASSKEPQKVVDGDKQQLCSIVDKDETNLYEGEFRLGLFHGKGTYRNVAQGYLYDGCWKEGKMHGAATVRFQNGDVWEGQFHQNHRGEGQYVHSDVFLLSPLKK